MAHGSGTTLTSINAGSGQDPIRNLGRISVDYTDGLTWGRGQLNSVPAGLFVVATGRVFNVRVLGTEAAPRAVFRLLSQCGGTADVTVAEDVYLSQFGELVDGQAVEVHGLAVRPFADMPAHLALVSARAAAGDFSWGVRAGRPGAKHAAQDDACPLCGWWECRCLAGSTQSPDAVAADALAEARIGAAQSAAVAVETARAAIHAAAGQR